jgi:hypothetical protein
MEILITYDKLTVIVGVIDSLKLEEFLDTDDVLPVVGLKRRTILKRLQSAQALDLSLPAIGELMDLLVAVGGLSTQGRQNIADYVTSQQIQVSAPIGQPAHNYRVPRSNAPEGENPVIWVSRFMTAYCSAWVEGDWILVATNGACTAPGTEVV